MKIGLILPTIGPIAGTEAMDAGAGIAHELGWDSVWVTDHLMVPAGKEAGEYGQVLEATSALTFVAARYDRLKVGFSVIVPAMRDAPLLAKQLATIDVLSGGRLVIGVGVSEKHDLPEYENLGKADRFKRRGAYLDEALRLWRHLWSGSTDEFVGEFNHLHDYNFLPLPVQGADIPIWCGGRSDRALRRAGELADGYHAAQTGPADVEEKLPKLREEAEKAGRPVPLVSVRVRVRFQPDPLPVYSMYGSAESMRREMEAFAAVGAQELCLVLQGNSPEEYVANARRFHEEVVEPTRATLAAS